MVCGIFLALIASCLLIGVSNTQDNNNRTGVYCWECTISKSMDNRVISMWDEVDKEQVYGNQCKAHQCQNGQDWCLVTYYRIRGEGSEMESKKERHQCGSRNDRDRDTACQGLLAEDKDHNSIVPRTCKTKRFKKDDSDDVVQYCWECTIAKSMDNRITSMWDEVDKEAVQGNQCKTHQCQNGQNWCLVTYYRTRGEGSEMESKRERHECGNRNDRDRDARCQALLAEDKDYNSIVPRTCKTKRSRKSFH
ncbi:uncharacterized protein LOC134821336 [Bolinopsis microptera]|uniref:uncharacterized protein LOC134821336 n=1 Tax=Bolinopsis microptera TaxID=2820187 RepID=UPI00307AE48A